MSSSARSSQLLSLTPQAKELSAFLKTLPVVQHAFAYGSGIFPQKGLYESGGRGKGPMLDFIFAVEDPEAWHEQVRHLLVQAWLVGSPHIAHLSCTYCIDGCLPWQCHIFSTRRKPE